MSVCCSAKAALPLTVLLYYWKIHSDRQTRDGDFSCSCKRSSSWKHSENVEKKRMYAIMLRNPKRFVPKTSFLDPTTYFSTKFYWNLRVLFRHPGKKRTERQEHNHNLLEYIFFSSLFHQHYEYLRLTWWCRWDQLLATVIAKTQSIPMSWSWWIIAPVCAY